MAKPTPTSGGIMETMMGLGPLITALIAMHLAALLAWIVLLMRSGTKAKKSIKQQ